MSGGSSGGGRRGGNAGIDEQEITPSRDWPRLLRAFDSGGAFVANSTRLHWAGVSSPNAGNSTNGWGSASSFAGLSNTNDRYYAIPEWFPRAGTIKRIAMFAQKAGLLVAGRFQLHLYSSGTCEAASFLGFPYPDRLLASGTSFTDPAISQGVAVGPTYSIYDSLIDYAVDDQTLLWFVLRCNTSFLSGDKWAHSRGLMPPWIPMTIGNAAGQNNDVLTQGYGWSHTTTWVNGADSTFPQTSPVVMPGAGNFTIDVPSIAYGFAED